MKKWSYVKPDMLNQTWPQIKLKNYAKKHSVRSTHRDLDLTK